MNIKFVTSNKNKFKEVQREIPEIEQIELDLEEIQSLNPEEIIRYKLEKATHVVPETSLMIDDTSFTIDKIGLPGSLVRFFLENVGDEGIYKIAKTFDAFEATVINKIGFYNHIDKTYKFFDGVVKGKIVEPKGESFGFDTIFIPEGYDKRYSEMLDVKYEIGHRALALKEFKKYLELNNL